jgi:hypothetical protein
MPDTDNILQLSKLFGVSTDYLLNDDIVISNDLTSACATEPFSEGQSNTSVDIPNNNGIEEIAQSKPQKPPLLLDITVALVTVFAMWSILRIPAVIGYSIVGFFTITIQIAAVLYIPIYLFLIRPRKMRHIKTKELIGKAAVLNRIFWASGTVCVLTVCFALCSQISYELHGNRDWSFVMFLLGLVVVLVAAIAGAKKVIVCAAVGYVFSFIVGIIFNFENPLIIDGIVMDRRPTWWQIWTISFVAVIVAGIIWEVISKRMKKKQLNKV